MGKEEELKRKEQIDNLKKDLEAYNSSIPGKLNAGKLEEVITELLGFEKKARLLQDNEIGCELCTKMLNMCFEKGNWDKINDLLIILSKKRQQHRKVITAFVDQTLGFVDKCPTLDIKIKLIDTIRTVSEGKIFVELQHAHATYNLCKIYEEKNDLEKAAEILDEIQVETIGSMELREKTEILLEQMRLRLATDIIRARLIMRKIDTKTLEKEELQDLKLKYYDMLITFDARENDVPDLAECYYAIYNTPIIKADEAKWKDILRRYVIFLLLTNYDNTKSDKMHRLLEFEKKALEKTEDVLNLLKSFTTNELILWSLENTQEITKQKSFTDEIYGNRGSEWIKLFQKRNIRIISLYYTQIRYSRFIQLLGLKDDEAEIELSEMVCEKAIYARINRPAGIINFRMKKTTNDVLNGWSDNINEIVKTLEHTYHLIEKEEVH